MTQQDIVDALNGRLAQFTGVPPADIAWEGLTYRPILPRPYLSQSLASYTRQAIGVGVNAVVQHDGTYAVVAFGPTDDGRTVAGHLAGQLVRLFGRGTVLAAGTAPAIPLILVQVSEQAGYSGGDWFAVPVMVTFTAVEAP